LEPIQGIIILVLFFLGLVTGGLSNVTSGGAGIFTIYFLTNYAGLAIQQSTGTVLAASTVIVLVGGLAFYRRGKVDGQLAVTVGISGVVSAFFAARWAATIQSSTLEEAFGGFTLALAVYTGSRFYSEWRSGKYRVVEEIGEPGATQAIPGQVQVRSRWAGRDPAALAVQVAKGALIGAATGLFGVGLASLSVVLFFLLFKLETNVILGTSLIASFFRYLGGTAGYISTGEINAFYFLVLVAGGGIGSLVGAKFILGGGKGSKDVYIKLLVVGILVFISYEFLLKRLV
jgi:uncharacterized protein